jgi:hypothetical protein
VRRLGVPDWLQSSAPCAYNVSDPMQDKVASRSRLSARRLTGILLRTPRTSDQGIRRRLGGVSQPNG